MFETISTGAVTPRLEPAAAHSADTSWRKRMAAFNKPDDAVSVAELAVTAGLFAVSWVLALLCLKYLPLLFPIAVIVPGLLIVRLFIIQHDCGHGSYFSSPAANLWAGRVLGVITLTPYAYWRHQHALHHASCGNLDKRGYGDVDTLTVEEYSALSPLAKFKYRMYRNPWVMFGLGPSYLFLLRQRFPVGWMNRGWKPWASTMGTNAVILALFILGSWLLGAGTFLTVHLPVVIIGGTVGIWLFYVQHQFDPTHWDRAEEWNREESALLGSSYYALPPALMWLTGYIGIHHVHHLASGIPFYNLPKVIEAYPELKTVNRLTFRESLKCVNYALWDEANRRLVSMREYGEMAAARA